MTFKGTIAVEEAVISPDTAWLLQESQQILTPGDTGKQAIETHKARLMDIHGSRLDSMNAEGVRNWLRKQPPNSMTGWQARCQKIVAASEDSRQFPCTTHTKRHLSWKGQ
jgi:hypothetical protein